MRVSEICCRGVDTQKVPTSPSLMNSNECEFASSRCHDESLLLELFILIRLASPLSMPLLMHIVVICGWIRGLDAAQRQSDCIRTDGNDPEYVSDTSLQYISAHPHYTHFMSSIYVHYASPPYSLLRNKFISVFMLIYLISILFRSLYYAAIPSASLRISLGYPLVCLSLP